MLKPLAKLMFFLLMGTFLSADTSLINAGFPNPSITASCFAQVQPEPTRDDEAPRIQWFREEMKISPRYLEHDEGIMGMSWTHFFTMLFLVLFFVAAMAGLVMRQRRTRQLLNRLLEEEEENGADS